MGVSYFKRSKTKLLYPKNFIDSSLNPKTSPIKKYNMALCMLYYMMLGGGDTSYF